MPEIKLLLVDRNKQKKWFCPPSKSTVSGLFEYHMLLSNFPSAGWLLLLPSYLFWFIASFFFSISHGLSPGQTCSPIVYKDVPRVGKYFFLDVPDPYARPLSKENICDFS